MRTAQNPTAKPENRSSGASEPTIKNVLKIKKCRSRGNYRFYNNVPVTIHSPHTIGKPIEAGTRERTTVKQKSPIPTIIPPKMIYTTFVL